MAGTAERTESNCQAINCRQPSAFPVVGRQIWNDLPEDVTRQLSRCLHFVGDSKRISSQNHFLTVSRTLTNHLLVVLAVVFTTLATLKQIWLID